MELRTRRLLLRPLITEDAPALVRGLNNFCVTRNLAQVKFPYTLHDAEAFIARQQNVAGCGKVMAITFACASEEAIGVISYEQRPAGRYEFGYWLSESCWGMRIMSEAAAAMLAHAFLEDDIAVLQSGYHLDNPYSGRILARLGFSGSDVVQEACLAQAKSVACMRLELRRDSYIASLKSMARDVYLGHSLQFSEQAKTFAHMLG